MTAVNLLSFKSVKAHNFVLFLTMLVVQLKRAAAVSRQHVAKKVTKIFISDSISIMCCCDR